MFRVAGCAGLQASAAKFFIFFLDLFLGTMCASAIAFLVSASVGVFAIANIIVVLILIVMMVVQYKTTYSFKDSYYKSVTRLSEKPVRLFSDVTKGEAHGAGQ